MVSLFSSAGAGDEGYYAALLVAAAALDGGADAAGCAPSNSAILSLYLYKTSGFMSLT